MGKSIDVDDGFVFDFFILIWWGVIVSVVVVVLGSWIMSVVVCIF